MQNEIQISSHLIFAIIFGLYCFLNYNSFDDNTEKRDEIKSFINENRDIIEESIQSENFRKLKEKGISVTVDDYNMYIRFECFSDGFATVGTERGFIYSTNHNTDAFLLDSLDIYKKKVSGKSTKYIDFWGGNNCYIEEIQKNYYYYEQKW